MQYEFCELRRSTSEPGKGIVKRSGSSLTQTEKGYFSSLISQLGDAGWSMTGIDPEGTMYFQRSLKKPCLNQPKLTSYKTRVKRK